MAITAVTGVIARATALLSKLRGLWVAFPAATRINVVGAGLRYMLTSTNLGVRLARWSLGVGFTFGPLWNAFTTSKAMEFLEVSSGINSRVAWYGRFKGEDLYGELLVNGVETETGWEFTHILVDYALNVGNVISSGTCPPGACPVGMVSDWLIFFETLGPMEALGKYQEKVLSDNGLTKLDSDDPMYAKVKAASLLGRSESPIPPVIYMDKEIRTASFAAPEFGAFLKKWDVILTERPNLQSLINDEIAFDHSAFSLNEAVALEMIRRLFHKHNIL